MKRMDRMNLLFAISCCTALLASCNLLDKKSNEENARAMPVPTADPVKSPTTVTTPGQVTQANATAIAKPETAEVAPGRTNVPTLSEWASVREVTVKGSSALGCETKMVREWLRVSCRGRNDTNGTPTTISVIRGAGADRYTYAAGGVTSMVMPFVEGADIEAVFSWTDKSHKLVVRWPRGSAKPVVVGVFEGAASPLDAKQCMECMDEGDENTARVQGKTCCRNQPCSKRSDCEKGRQCCAGIMNAFCGVCDMGNSTPVCESDADCPAPFGMKLVCRKHHMLALKNCQSE